MDRQIRAPDKEWLRAHEAASWIGLAESTWEALEREGLIPPGLVVKRVKMWSWSTVLGVSLLLPFLLSQLPKSATVNGE